MSYFCSPKTGDSLAQQVEHNTFNVGVLGSSPRRITEKPSEMKAFLFMCGGGVCCGSGGIGCAVPAMRLLG